MILSLITGPLIRAASTVLDAQALYAFPSKTDFPRVRLFGSFGYGVLALVVGYLCSNASSN